MTHNFNYELKTFFRFIVLRKIEKYHTLLHLFLERIQTKCHLIGCKTSDWLITQKYI